MGDRSGPAAHEGGPQVAAAPLHEHRQLRTQARGAARRVPHGHDLGRPAGADVSEPGRIGLPEPRRRRQRRRGFLIAGARDVRTGRHSFRRRRAAP